MLKRMNIGDIDGRLWSNSMGKEDGIYPSKNAAMQNRLVRSLLALACLLLPCAAAGAQTSAPTPAASPSPGDGLPENPAITTLATRWVQHLQSRPASDLRAMTLQDGPVLVVAAGVLAAQGDPVAVKYAGGSPPNDRIPMYIYLYDFQFQHSNVREILMVDSAGNVHEVMFTSDHPVSL